MNMELNRLQNRGTMTKIPRLSQGVACLLEKKIVPKEPSWKVRTKKQTTTSCDTKLHPSHHREIERIELVREQVSELREMLSSQTYWVDVIEKIQKTRKILTHVEGNIHERHVAGCLREAMLTKDEDTIEEQIGELVKVFKRYGG
jgi:CsoR family transcriptional regulator, copper-sensing transcriptional repressor